MSSLVWTGRSSFGGSSFPGVSARDRSADHLLVDGDDGLAVFCGGSRVEFEAADHAPENLAQRAGAEAFLTRGIPGDVDECAAGDLQVNAEAFEVIARRPEDRAFRLHEDL